MKIDGKEIAKRHLESKQHEKHEAKESPSEEKKEHDPEHHKHMIDAISKGDHEGFKTSLGSFIDHHLKKHEEPKGEKLGEFMEKHGMKDKDTYKG